MANHKGSKIVLSLKSAPISILSFSGTVKLAAVGVVRKIIGFQVDFPTVLYGTESDGDGNWSLEMKGGSNDKFRIIAIGENGENSEIFDGLSG